MTPTPKLRYVEREQRNYWSEGIAHVTIIKVLQQWFAVERSGQITPEGEWQDVPLEKEQ